MNRLMVGLVGGILFSVGLVEAQSPPPEPPTPPTPCQLYASTLKAQRDQLETQVANAVAEVERLKAEAVKHKKPEQVK